MCLGVPGRVVSVEGYVATVDFWGVRKQVQLQIVDEPVGPGDYILNHVGYAIRKIPADEISATLAMYDDLLGGKAEDLMRQDVENELGAAREGSSGVRQGSGEGGADQARAAATESGPGTHTAAGARR